MSVVHVCEQGSSEWHALRAGVLTASEFVTMRAVYVKGERKGQPSGAALDCAFRKAVERIGGKALDGEFENYGMRRGHDLEPAARLEHEVQLGETVHRCGFVTTDDGRFGASLDGMIGHRKGGAEYKCFTNPAKLRGILLDGELDDVTDQVQGGIWIAELEWIDFCLYVPELAPAGGTLWHRRIYRDDDYIKALKADLERFDEIVEGYVARIKARMSGADANVAASREIPKLSNPLTAAEPAVLSEKAEAETVAGVWFPPGVYIKAAPSPELVAAFNAIEVVDLSPTTAVLDAQVVAAGAVDTSEPMLKLGDINKRISPLSITADGLGQLGFPFIPAKQAGKLYLESKWPLIREAIAAHVAALA